MRILSKGRLMHGFLYHGRHIHLGVCSLFIDIRRDIFATVGSAENCNEHVCTAICSSIENAVIVIK